MVSIFVFLAIRNSPIYVLKCTNFSDSIFHNENSLVYEQNEPKNHPLQLHFADSLV